jgi:hypothetical protein
MEAALAAAYAVSLASAAAASSPSVREKTGKRERGGKGGLEKRDAQMKTHTSPPPPPYLN